MKYSIYGIKPSGEEVFIKSFSDKREAKSVWSQLRNATSKYGFNPTVKLKYCNYVVKEEA